MSQHDSEERNQTYPLHNRSFSITGEVPTPITYLGKSFWGVFNPLRGIQPARAFHAQVLQHLLHQSHTLEIQFPLTPLQIAFSK